MRARLCSLTLITVLLLAGSQASRQTVSPVRSAALSPLMMVSPVHATAGTTITMTVTGFPANQGLLVYWNRTASRSGTLVCWQSITDHTGKAQCSFRLPTTATGSFPVVAIADNGTRATAKVTAAGSILGVGTYRIGATKEGLVGGVTSSGHVITPHDHFVALPACTARSCNWLTPGTTDRTYGYVTPCGTNCYVRVANPRTGVCEVAPVADLGPWFTNDDWWRPTDVRRLNNLSTTVTVLPQGYLGVDAARDGLDVGYGRTAQGIGYSNVGHVVGLRAGIDLADGTWEDIGLSSTGVDWVVATLLWQTGEDHTAAAAACGQSVTPPAPRTVTLTPTRGTPGTTVTVRGTGFQTNEIVDLYLASTTTAPIGRATVTRDGTFVGTFKLPHRPAGRVSVVVKGRVSGLKASSSFQVTPSLSRSPTEGPVGTKLTVTARGFARGEVVTIRWDTASGPQLAHLTASTKGTTSGTVTIPPGSQPGSHALVAVGAMSGLRASRSVTVTTGTAQVSLSSTTGSPRSRLVVSGSGFTAGEPVDLFWDLRTTPAGSGTADGQGTVAMITSTVPLLPAGAHTVMLKGQTSGRLGTAIYTVVPHLTVSPTSGPEGTVVTVKGRGWPAGVVVTVSWTTSASTSATAVCAPKASTSGSFTCTFPVPDGAAGDAQFGAVAGAHTARARFTVIGASIASEDETPIARGTPTQIPTASVTPSSTPTPIAPESTLGDTPTVSPSASSVIDLTPSALPTESVMTSPTPTATSFQTPEAPVQPTEEATAEPSTATEGAREATVTPTRTTAPSGASRPIVRLSERTVAAGATIALQGRGFAPGLLEIWWENDTLLATAEVGADGQFAVDLTIPAEAEPGGHVLILRDSDGHELRHRIRVIDPSRRT